MEQGGYGIEKLKMPMFCNRRHLRIHRVKSAKAEAQIRPFVQCACKAGTSRSLAAGLAELEGGQNHRMIRSIYMI